MIYFVFTNVSFVMVFSRSKLPDFDDIMHQFYHAVRASEGEESNIQQGNF